VNFWGSWCDPCKAEAPLLEETWRRYRSRGLIVLGVDFHDVKGEARRFARENDMTYPIAYDGPGNILSDYGVEAAPETFFVSRTGRLVCERIQAGLHLERNRPRFDRCVRELLGA
jgi:cytochrome c biogenesis protein CcmG, thiol:disulfide interchange protein DsbE